MNNTLNMHARNQLLHTLITKNGGYHLQSKKKKSQLLDEYCRLTGQNRKYVIRKIRSGQYIHTLRGEQKKHQKRRRRSLYDGHVVAHLITLWNIFDHPSGQRMVIQIKTELPRLRRLGELLITNDMAEKLHIISSAQIDRLLSSHKEKEHLKQRKGKKIHPLLYQKIPVKISQDQNRKQLGNIQIDLVEHCGQNAEGVYMYTLSTTDLATNWWQGGAVLTKSMGRVTQKLDALRSVYPFPWQGFHSDNDSAFLNGHLYRYAQKENLLFSRSRPYEKNDNYLVEQKNGRVVRRTVGYVRYDTEEELNILHDLYHRVALYHNFFQPVMKLKEKKRIGSTIKKIFEPPMTPYQRVLRSRTITKKQRQRLRSLYETLNPAELKRQIEAKQHELYHVYQQKKHVHSSTTSSRRHQNSLSVTFFHDSTKEVLVT